jgi:hypothetical protein
MLHHSLKAPTHTMSPLHAIGNIDAPLDKQATESTEQDALEVQNLIDLDNEARDNITIMHSIRRLCC